MTHTELDRIDAQFAEVKESLKRIDEAVRGNGKPGLTIRIDRLERSRALHNKALWALLVTACGLGASWIRSFWT